MKLVGEIVTNMSSFTEDQLEKKLLALKDTHEAISSLSQWCLENNQHHKKIVSIWLQVLKKVKIEQRLTLFYLANDVIQYSKRKSYNFVESWGTALQKATTMVRDDKVKNKILRLFKIWNERSIYDEAFLVDLSGLLSSRQSSQNSQDAQDFQPISLITKIRTCKTLEDDTDLKRKILNDSHLSLNDADALHSFLKDRRHGADLEQELEDGVKTMTDFISALKTEIKERKGVIEMLDQAESFYENQRGEAKVVCNAYRNFSKRVENLKKKLDELTKSLPSPVPSPDINAPSPSPESDIDLPDDDLQGDYSGASSFIGKMVMPDKIQLSSLEGYNPQSPIESPPRRKQGYKPPTPPRSFKRKSSPKTRHSSSPPASYVPSTTPTLSNSSASNYSTNSPYQQPTTKPNSVADSAVYSIPSTYSLNTNSYAASGTYTAAVEPYNPTLYNPEDNELSNSYSTPSPESYHVPGANPPPPTFMNPPPPTTFMNPPPPAEYPARNPSPVGNSYVGSNYQQSGGQYEPGRSFSPTPPFERPEEYLLPAAPPPDYSVPPPSNEYKPFYSATNTLTMPPLLGEDCPPSSTSSLDRFLQGNSSPQNGPGSGFSSFMGNLSLPFEFQKGLFSDVSCENNRSSPPRNVDDSRSNSQMDAYFSDSNNEIDGGGKPIEVINRTKQPDLSEILKAIGIKGLGRGKAASPPTLPPPPLPPTPAEDKPWSQPPLLPPKFPTWGQNNWPDTPASPPLYEKSGFSEPVVELEESESVVLGETDTDLRGLGLQGDIDHRNLISLTSSPHDDQPWPPHQQDTDYRKLALAPKRTAPGDNVESVDMEMSSDEDMDTEEAKPPLPSVAPFSLSSHNKVLVDSPLVEEEEVVKKKLTLKTSPARKGLLVNPSPPIGLAVSDLTSPMEPVSVSSPPSRLPEPPPLPDVNDIFPEDSSEESDHSPGKLPSPPLPPPPPMPIQPIQTVHDVPVINTGYNQNQNPRGFFNPRFNNNRQRFPTWQNNQSNVRPRHTGQSGPRFRGEANFRGRPPFFRGNPRPPRFSQW